MVMKAVRAAVGPDYPVYFRISLEEGLEGGITFEDTLQTIDIMIAAGTDAVDLSNGATPRIPTFLEGFDTMTNLLTFEDILTGEDLVKAGKNLLILGGGEVGAEMADYLCGYDRTCTIIEMTHQIITDAAVQIQHDLGERLAKYGVEIYTDTKVTGFAHAVQQAVLIPTQL